jgi:hypothetical protein
VASVVEGGWKSVIASLATVAILLVIQPLFRLGDRR